MAPAIRKMINAKANGRFETGMVLREICLGSLMELR
jgi:hypothetical protein